MTEQEILQAPESEYMEPAQLVFFFERLNAIKDETRLKMQQLQASESDTHSAEADPADRASQEEERAMYFSQIKRDSDLLRGIEKALGRIANGDYGYCEDSGTEIGIRRLLANPTASRSVEAQERRERMARLIAA